MDYLPIFMDLRDRPAVLVGGGAVAARKAALLRSAGAALSVVAPKLGPQLAPLAARGAVRWHAHEVREEDLAGAALVIAATDDAVINARVAAWARARGVPVNVVDRPELCSFIMPAVVDRSPVVIAVSSGGRAPVLTRLLRARLETLIPAAYGELAALVGRFRARVRERLADPAARRHFWEEALQGPEAEAALAGRAALAEHLLETRLAQGGAPRGEVALVGAGPGDPDLLTFRALRLLQQADVIVHDRLVAPEILALARRDAELIHAGKEPGAHTLAQEDINALLVRLARAGKRVVRLKGGDPFIFGRGGEEIETLAAAGIPFQVVPGLTAASGCSAYAGIPLTHRDHAQHVVFVTGHQRDGRVDLPWERLVALGGTLVVYMGVGALPAICEALVRHGLAADTPAALVLEGTTARQRVVEGALAELPARTGNLPRGGPGLIIVGSVVRLREKLRWFEAREVPGAPQDGPPLPPLPLDAARAAVREYLAGEFPDYLITTHGEGAHEVFTLEKGDMRHVLRLPRASLEATDEAALRRVLESRKIAERLVEYGAMPVRVSF
jgi:uroporphyrin-III C-methyltransferase / precorrin-2 dehydrogenase / sirohydrochlorin ferrochelatase